MAKRRIKARPPVRDWHLWTAVARTVSPLRPDDPLPPAPEETAAPTVAGDRTVDGTPPPRRARPPEPSAPPAGPYGLEPRVYRRVRRGRLPIDATIDLHGMRQADARAALQRFIAARAARGDRTVLVITGKGLRKEDEWGTVITQRGVLRAMLPVWLAEPALRPLIAGWDVAAQGHGGEGAYYVRLRRPGEGR